MSGRQLCAQRLAVACVRRSALSECSRVAHTSHNDTNGSSFSRVVLTLERRPAGGVHDRLGTDRIRRVRIRACAARARSTPCATGVVLSAQQTPRSEQGGSKQTNERSLLCKNSLPSCKAGAARPVAWRRMTELTGERFAAHVLPTQPPPAHRPRMRPQCQLLVSHFHGTLLRY